MDHEWLIGECAADGSDYSADPEQDKTMSTQFIGSTWLKLLQPKTMALW